MKTVVASLSIIAMFLISMSAQASELEIRDDGTAMVKGEVTGHTSRCEVDGVCSLILNVNGQTVFLDYAEGDTECANMKAAAWVKWGRNVKVGTVVQALGAYKKQGDTLRLRFCDSEKYYITEFRGHTS